MKHVVKLIRFSAAYFGSCVVFATILFCILPMSLGLATRAFFDAFSGQAGLNVWTAIALIASLQIGEVVADLAMGVPAVAAG